MSDEISKRLQTARAGAGFKTASDAARRFGWNENTYRSHENGERGLKTDVAFKYAAAFGVSPAFILVDEKFHDLDYSETWRAIAGSLDDTGDVVNFNRTSSIANRDYLAIFDASIHKKVVAVEYVGLRDYGIFSRGDLALFVEISVNDAEIGQYCLIQTDHQRSVIRMFKPGDRLGTVDIAARVIDSPKIITPIWVATMFVMFPNGRWDKMSTKDFVNRTGDPRRL